MGSRTKKRLKNKLGKKVLAGKMTVTEARARLGREFAQKSGFAPVIKAARAQGKAAADAGWLTEQVYLATEPMRAAAEAVKAARPVTEDDVRAAARWDGGELREQLLRKARQAAPAPRADPRQQLMIMKSWQAERDAAAAARPPHYWTGVQLGLLNEYRTNPDPRARENARAALVNEGIVI